MRDRGQAMASGRRGPPGPAFPTGGDTWRGSQSCSRDLASRWSFYESSPISRSPYDKLQLRRTIGIASEDGGQMTAHGGRGPAPPSVVRPPSSVQDARTAAPSFAAPVLGAPAWGRFP